MIFYDFEVFEKDWLAVFIDVTKKKEHVIINSPDKLKALYEANRKDIWVGFNNRHYDQYIMKGILLGMNPKKINDWIIVDNKEGWQYSRAFNKLPMINYDVMPSNDETMKTVGLKTMEGFLGSNIKETDVDFRIKRKLTQEEIEQTVKYCRHDVEQTIKVFLEKVSEFNAVHGIIQAFPKETSLYDIGDSEARITAKVLGCSKTHFGDEFDFFFLPCLKLKKYKYVQEWFAEKRKEALEMGLQDFDKKDKKTWYKSQNFETIVAGIPHTFGFGGLHGASDKPIHRKGQILHVDVNNYYPSMLIAWGLVTRAATNNNFKLVYDTRKAMKKKQIAVAKAGRKAEAKQWKKAQLPYKKMLNALSGAMKDETNAACLVYMGGLSGVSRNDLEQRITYYLEKTSLTEHQNKKMRQLSGGMKRRVGLIQALLNNPDFLIIDEPTTGLDPEERIRIRNLLVDFSKDRTVLFSTHVVEDLAATCTQLAIMKKGNFLYSGSVSGLLENAKGCVWNCTVQNAEEARLLEANYSISSKQYVENGIHMKILSKGKPNEKCVPDNDITLEDAYIYLTNS